MKLQNNTIILCLSLTLIITVNAQASKQPHKPFTFAAGDIFNSAVFIQNNNLIENNTGEDILYYSSHDHLNTYFAKTGLIYNLHKSEAKEDTGKGSSADFLKKNDKEKEEKYVTALTGNISMQWVGANKNVQVIAGRQCSGYHTYLKHTANGLTSVSSSGFNTITYKNLYPGIDVVYSFPDKGGLEYTLQVEPGADITKVHMAYGHDITGITTDAAGNITLHSNGGDITEHAPVTNDEDGRIVPSELSVANNVVSFGFPKGYDKSKSLVIDPWVTALTMFTPENIGLNVDYDFNGNLFVYGAGPTNDVDETDNFEVAKYGPAGNFIWVFNGTVPSIGWVSAAVISGSPTLQCPGNFIVDKITGKAYLGKQEVSQGTTVIRINTAGAWDNFVSTPVDTFLEDWGLLYRCSDGSLLALGGGINSDINMGVVNTGTGSVNTSTITGDYQDFQQDIVCGVYDSAGNLYVIMNDNVTPSLLPYTNTLFKVNNSFNGNVWTANTNFTTFAEALNDAFWLPLASSINGENGNWVNALAANGHYLFYYDGQNLAAYNLATGAALGTPVVVGSYTALLQTGIAVDNCDHVYIGGIGVIKVYTFTGTGFTANADIPLGGGFTGKAVIDVKYNSSNNLLYVTGNGFAGTYTAYLSGACSSSSYKIAASGTCPTATVHISPSAALNPKVFNIIWTNSSGAVVSQLLNTSDTINTISGLTSGTYTVVVQWNTNCGGSALVDTVTINCNNPSLHHSNDTIVCSGQQALLSATGSPVGGTYLWTPGNFTTPSITVTPVVTTIYTVTYTPPTGAPLSANITVTINTQPVTVTVNNAGLCPDSTANLLATPSVPGGTYSWAPGGYTTQSISVSPLTTTTYSVTYNSPCGSATGTGVVTVVPAPTEALNQTGTTCAYSNGKILVTAGSGTAPYQYSLSGGAFQAADSFTNLSAASYTVVVKDTNGCGVTGNIQVASSTGVTASLVPANPACTAATGSITVNATGGVTPYSYTLNGGTSQTVNTFDSLAAGTYIVKTFDAGGCAHTDTAVLSGSSMALTLIADSESCFNGASSTITAHITGGSPGYSYSLNGGTAVPGNQFTQLSAGIYSVTATDANGCTVTSADTIYQPTKLVIDSLTATQVFCPGQQTGTIGVYVHGGTPGYEYAASKIPLNYTYTANSRLTGLDTGLYTIYVADSRGCSLTGPVFVASAQADSFVAMALPTSCYGPGHTDGMVIITPVTATGTPFSYSIDGGAFQASDTFKNLAPGIYYPQGKNNSGCIYNLVAVNVTQPLQATLTIYPGDTTLQLGQSVELTSSFGPYGSSSITSYNWSPNIGLSCINCPNPVVTPYASQNTYQLMVTYNEGCIIDATVHIEVNDDPNIFIPNVFTPNGDGNNDVFYIYGANIKLLNYKIFNRWGEKVFESNNQQTGWDGTYKGKLQDPSVFTYEAYMILLDNTTIHHKGTVTLVR